MPTWTIFLSSREHNLRMGIEPPTSPFGFGFTPLSSGGLGSSLTIETLLHTRAYVKGTLEKIIVILDIDAHMHIVASKSTYAAYLNLSL